MEEEVQWKDEVKNERKGREDAGIDGFVMLGFSTALDSHGVEKGGRAAKLGDVRMGEG